MTNNRKQFMDTWSGKRLTEKYSLQETGMWQIFGEDSNCDLGGSHVQPSLGFVKGKLDDIIDYAVGLAGFWTWGGGGNIVKVDTVKQITSSTAAHRTKLKAQRADLEAAIAAIDAELEDL